MTNNSLKGICIVVGILLLMSIALPIVAPSVSDNTQGLKQDQGDNQDAYNFEHLSIIRRGDEYKLSKNSDFSTEDRDFSLDDTLYIYVKSTRIDHTNMKKAEYEIKVGGVRVKKSLTNNNDGTFTVNEPMNQFSPGNGMVRMKLEDKNRNKYDTGNIAITVTEVSDTTPPGQVTGLTVTTISSSRLGLSWDANQEADLDHYNVYRRPEYGIDFEYIASPTTNLYSDSGLEPSTTYSYKVSAVDNSNNEGTALDIISATTMEGAAGEGYILSKDPGFSTDDREFFLDDTLYMKVWSDRIDHTNMKKAEYEIKVGGVRVKKPLWNNDDGTFTANEPMNQFPIGSGTVKMKLEDKNRKRYDTGNIPITVVEGPDTIPPICTITNPTDSQTVYGTVTVTADASDDRAVDYVGFRIDGGVCISDYDAPYTYSWDTTQYQDKTNHIVHARSFDTSGNQGDAESVSCYVNQNAAPLTEHYAVIVGVSDYKAINDLSFCDEDATDWYNYFISIGYPRDHILVYGDTHENDYPKYDGKATEANVKSALQNVIASAGSEDIISFTFSGHGGGNWNSYLCMWDCASGEGGEDGDFTDDELAAILETSIADRIFVFLDSCHSGGMGDDLMKMDNAVHVYCTTTCNQAGYGYDVPAYLNGAWTYWFEEKGLVEHFGSNPDTTMEECHMWADAQYNPGGNNEPMEFDGDSSQDFTLW